MSDEEHRGSGQGEAPNNPPPRVNNPIYNPEACKAIDEFFSLHNQWQFQTYVEELAGAAPDAVIMVLGLLAADENQCGVTSLPGLQEVDPST